MFNTVAINVAVGLIFIYLLYSLLATIIQELIAKVFNLRARLLTHALRRMLEDDDHRNDLGVYGHFTFFSWFYEAGWRLVFFFTPFRKNSLLKQFYATPTIYYLGENRAAAKPSYISPALFSQVMIHLLRGKHYDHTQDQALLIRDNLAGNALHICPDTLLRLRLLFEDAQQDTGEFRKKLEAWFNETMTRATGWYKKQTQSWLLVIGFMIAWQFNVDTIAIARTLMADKPAQEQIMGIHPAHAYRMDTLYLRLSAQLDPYAVAYLSKQDLQVFRQTMMKAAQENICHFQHPYQQNTSLVFAGWGITALAISLGASFWFDMLNRFIHLRSSGPQVAGSGSHQ